MILLNKKTFENAKDYIEDNARDLEKAMFKDRFVSSSDDDVLRSLRKYQNRDGGFGNALESDFRLPLSSPMSTSKAFNIIMDHDSSSVALPMIIGGIKYLESTYDKDRVGWFSVPKEVNDYPHAFWWAYDENTKMTMIDNSWGNPSADIIGIIYRYREHTTILDINSLIVHAIEYFKAKKEYNSQHEVYCFINLQRSLPENLANSLDGALTRAVGEQVCYDIGKWDTYESRPLDYVKSPESRHYGIPNDKIDINLDYIIKELESNGYISPNWDTSGYEEGLRPAITEWNGTLTLRALMLLDNFKRIEK